MLLRGNSGIRRSRSLGILSSALLYLLLSVILWCHSGMLLKQDAKIIRVLISDLFSDFVKFQRCVVQKFLRRRNAYSRQVFDECFPCVLLEYKAEIACTHQYMSAQVLQRHLIVGIIGIDVLNRAMDLLVRKMAGTFG